MLSALAPIGFAMLLWWFTTGVILYLDGLPRRTYRWSFGAASILALAAVWGLVASASDASAMGAYIAFTCAIVIWGWHEMAFLMGFVTGPRRTPCPPGAAGFVRALYATETLLHHEIAIAATGLALLALTADSANPVGAATFCALWALRISAKLNIFLGVRNLAEEFLPAHLAYLQSYFTRAPMNPLFPVSVTAGTVAAVLFAQAALAADPGSAASVGFLLVATLVALGVLEHWFMVLPLPFEALWRWGMASRRRPANDLHPLGPPRSEHPAPALAAAQSPTLFASSRRRP